MVTPTPSWNTTRVHGTWLNFDGSMKAGTYKVTMPVRVTNATDDVIIPKGVFASGPLNTTPGLPSLDLQVLASDDPDNSPVGFQPIIEVTFLDAPGELYALDIPVALSGDANGINLRQVVLTQSLPTPVNVLIRGVAGGLAELDSAGDVIDASGAKVKGGGAALVVVTTVTASATLVAAKHTPVNATSGAKTMTLPTTAAAGVLISVEKTDATTNAVTITGTLRGITSSIPLTSQFEVRTFLSEGSGSWRPVSDHRTAASLAATITAQVGTAVAPQIDTARLTNQFVRLAPSLFPNWLAALAKVRAGTGNAKVLVVGDSTTFGSATVPADNWPYKMAQRLAALDASLPVVFGGTAPNSTTPRYATGTGWPSGRNYGFGSGGYQYSSPAGTLTYTDPLVNADRFDVYHMKQVGSTSLTLQVDSETPVVVDTSGAGSATLVKTTITAATASTNHVLKITASGVGAVLFVEPWLSTSKQVRVATGAVSTTDAATWASGSVIYSEGLAALYAPDLYIIALGGVNDGVVSRTPAAYRAAIDHLIANKPAGSDILLVSAIPSQTSPEKELEPEYAKQLRLRTDVGFVDLFNYAQSWDRWNSLGYYIDNRHPNAPGMTAMADLMTAAVTRISDAPADAAVAAPATSETQRWVTASEFSVVTGSPALTPIGGSRVNAWAFDAAATEQIRALTLIPAGWATFKVTAYWANSSTGTGDVMMAVKTMPVLAGTTTNGTGEITQANVTATAGAQDVAVATDVATGVAVPTSRLMNLMYLRRATDAADTLANDSALLGLMLTKVT